MIETKLHEAVHVSNGMVHVEASRVGGKIESCHLYTLRGRTTYDSAYDNRITVKLSNIDDMIKTLQELKDIKLVELGLGRNVNGIKITELNEMQTQILKLFKMKKNDIEKDL